MAALDDFKRTGLGQLLFGGGGGEPVPQEPGAPSGGFGQTGLGQLLMGGGGDGNAAMQYGTAGPAGAANYLDQGLQAGVDPYQQFMEYVTNYFGQSEVEPGPEFGQGVAQGPGIDRPGMRTARPEAPGPAAPPGQQAQSGVPFYLQRPDQLPSQTNAQPVGTASSANFHSGIDPYAFPGASAGTPQVQGPSPPAGDPEKNEYEAMVKDYLTKLQQPAEFPKPRQLAGIEALAVLMNPDKADLLLDQFQGQPYRNQVMQYQAEQQRAQQGLVGAEAMYTRKAELERRDAERAWFRESALANSGAPLPPGFRFLNPPLAAIHEQKRHDASMRDLRTAKYLAGTAKAPKPANKYEYLKQLQSEQARNQSALLSPGAKEQAILGQEGVGDPRYSGMMEGMFAENNEMENRIRVVNAMDDDLFDRFIELDGVKQEEIIQSYLQALKMRGMLPGSTSQSPTPGEPVGP